MRPTVDAQKPVDPVHLVEKAEDVQQNDDEDGHTGQP
jgi:hypothetical protein